MSSKIEQQVMASVATIYVARKLFSRTALECYALALCAFSLTILVSVSHVVQNFFGVARNPQGIPFYLSSAVAHTTTLVQLVLLIAVAALLALVIDLVRSVGAPRRNFAA